MSTLSRTLLRLLLVPGLAVIPTLRSQAPAQAPSAPAKALQNAELEEGTPGTVPAGWTHTIPSAKDGFRAELREGGAAQGRRCAVLFRDSGTAGFGNLKQAVEAAPYRGRRIRFSAMVRTEGLAEEAQAQLWMRVDGPGGDGFFDNMGDRPLRSGTWVRAHIIGDVAPDAVTIHLGLMLTGGNGQAWLDDVSVEILGPAPVGSREPARALTARGLKNLVVFGRALPLVRHFHPSDQSAAADWDTLAIEGVRTVEGARSTKDLAAKLQIIFAPYAPTAQFLAPGQKPAVAQALDDAGGLVRWSHRGIGLGPRGPYMSQRERAPRSARPSGWPASQPPLTVELGSGLKLLLPMVLPTDDQGATLPKPTPVPSRGSPPESAPLPRPTAGLGSGSGNDRSTRLANVMLAWGVFRHFYPYFDVTPTDWDAELPKALKRAALDADAEAFTHTLRRMVAALKDGHGSVSGPDRRDMGPALSLMILDGTAVVSLSEVAEVPVGSLILEVDGEPAEVRMTRLRSEISSASEGWLNVRLARMLLLGPQAEPVRLRIQPPTGKTAEVALPRSSASWSLARQKLPATVQELSPGIWYLDLDRAGDADFEAALPKLAAARGVIFDLRGYPKPGPSFLQHLSASRLQSAHWKVPVIRQPHGIGWEWPDLPRWDLPPKEPRITGRISFLTGGGAISYAESCLGIVEAYKLAEIVGEPTAGTNGNINPFELPGGYRVVWTGMKVLKHDGSRHHGVGIRPTVPVKPTVKGLAEGRDEVLEKAIEVVSR